MSLKRVIHSWFFLVCFLAPIGCTYLAIVLHRMAVREMLGRTTLPAHDDTWIRLSFSKQESQANLEWESEHEFTYQGGVYDVVQVSVQRDSVIYWVAYDGAETAWMNELDSLLSPSPIQDSASQKSHEQLFRFLNSLYAHVENLYTQPSPFYSITAFYFRPIHYTSTALSLLDPPPKV